MGDKIIEKYNEKSKKIIDEMDSVKRFKTEIEEKEDSIKNFKKNNKLMYKLLHPVKLIKNCMASTRIKYIRHTYENIYNSSVLEFVFEETGDLQEDLDYAAYKEKPAYINSYVKSIRIKK